MKEFRFIFLRLSFYLILGILAAFYLQLQLQILLISGVLILSLFLLAYFIARKTIFPGTFFGITSFLLIFYLGYCVTYLSIPRNQKEHYINQNVENDQKTILFARVSEELKPTAFSQRFILEAENLISETEKLDIKGKILLNLKVDSASISMLEPGMQLLLPWSPEKIKAPLNPFQFSYRDYMSKLQVEGQINIDISRIEIRDFETNTIISRSWKLREQLISELKKHHFGKDELAVFQALILGQRREINNNLYQNYATAGAIHILAISGLHIGILLLILNFLLKGLERIKYGRLIKICILISLLWSFAILTGLSPSVVRAVTMFSFIAVGLQMKRKTSVLNSLFLSLFVLLLINPYFLYQVGFQLSYLAVFSIITFQPAIYKLLKVNSKFVDYFWKLASVSLAAQIGVIPLSLYYFHQFPGLFLLSNLVILPFLGVILALGILIIILASIKLLPLFLVNSFNSSLTLLNEFVEWIAGIKSMVFTNIHITLLQTLSLYLIILAIFFTIRKVSFHRICFLLIGVFCFQLSTYLDKKNTPISETVIFHHTRKSVIGIKNKGRLSIYSEEDTISNFLSDYIRERRISNIQHKRIPDVIDLSNKLSLVIDTSRNYKIQGFHPEILILRNSPKVNLERLIDQLKPKEIIADGSNYHSYVNRWKETALHKKIPFYHTGEKGSYIMK